MYRCNGNHRVSHIENVKLIEHHKDAGFQLPDCRGESGARALRKRCAARRRGQQCATQLRLCQARVFLQTYPELDKDDCYCHKRPCQRAVGKMPAQQPPGRKRVRSDSPTVSVGLNAADDRLTRAPPILVSMGYEVQARVPASHDPLN